LIEAQANALNPDSAFEPRMNTDKHGLATLEKYAAALGKRVHLSVS
jgi:hypothetical protein